MASHIRYTRTVPCPRMILVESVVNEERSRRMLLFTGWAVPLLVSLPYILYRLNYENDNCWMDSGLAANYL